MRKASQTSPFGGSHLGATRMPSAYIPLKTISPLGHAWPQGELESLGSSPVAICPGELWGRGSIIKIKRGKLILGNNSSPH